MPKQVWEVSFTATDEINEADIADGAVLYTKSEVRDMLCMEDLKISKLKITKKGAK